jgi:hypothetical protein
MADSKPVKQEVNCTVTLPPLVFPGIFREYAKPGNTKGGSITVPLTCLTGLESAV